MKRIIAIVGPAGSGKDTTASFIRQEMRGGAASLAFADPLKEFARFVFGFTTEALWGPSEKRNEAHASSHDPIFWREARHLFDGKVVSWCREVLLTHEESEAHLALVAAARSWFNVIESETMTPGPNQPKGLTARRVLQTLGTDCARAVDADIWARYGVSRATSMLFGSTTTYKAVVITDCRFLNEARTVSSIKTPHVTGEVWLLNRNVESLTGTVSNHASERDMYTDEMRALASVTLDNHGSLDDLHALVRRALHQHDLTHGWE